MPQLPPILINKWLGLSTSVTSADQEPGFAARLENMRIWSGGKKLIQRRGQEQLSDFGGLGPIQGLAWHRLDTQEFLLAVVSGDVWDAYTGDLVPGGADRFPGDHPVNMAWLDHAVVLGEGYSPNVTAWLSGSTLVVSRLTVQPADSAAVTLASGSAATVVGTVGYAVKFVSARGVEGDIAGFSPTITVSGSVQLSNLPVCPAGQDCTLKHLYRTKDGGSVYFLVAELANSATTYHDTLPDNELGGEMLNLGFQNSPFPPCSILFATQNRLFGAGCFAVSGLASGSVIDCPPNQLFVSDVLDPTTARVATDPDTTYQGGRFSLEGAAGGEITGLGQYGSMVCVFAGGSFNLFVGNDPDTFQLAHYSTVGTCAARTVVSGDEVLFWLSPTGVYGWKSTGYLEEVLTSLNYQRVSLQVRDLFDGFSSSDLTLSSAAFVDQKLWISWPNGNAIYDLVYGAWYEDTGNLWAQLAASVFTPGARQRLYGARLGTAEVWQLDTGTTDGGAAIACRMRTADLDGGLPGQNKRVTWAGGLFRGTTETLSGSLIRNAGPDPFHTWTIGLTSGSVWQTTPAGATVVRMRQRPPDVALGEFFAFDAACDSRSGGFEILQVLLEVEPGGGCNG